MTQFKETEAFEELQTTVGQEIAGIFLARLQNYDIPEHQLLALADEICYDIASAMVTVGNFELPNFKVVEKEVVKEVEVIKEVVVEKTVEVPVPVVQAASPEPEPAAISFAEENTEEQVLEVPHPDDQDEEVETTEKLPALGVDDEMDGLEVKTDKLNALGVDAEMDEPMSISDELAELEPEDLDALFKFEADKTDELEDSQPILDEMPYVEEKVNDISLADTEDHRVFTNTTKGVMSSEQLSKVLQKAAAH